MLNKNNKGFTLVELIAIITLLAVLSVTILVNMVGIKGNEDNKNVDRFQKKVEEAACSYIDMIDNTQMRNNCKDSGCSVNLSVLYQDNIALIDSEEIDPYTNMKVTSEGDCIYVQINWVQKGTYKEKVCEMKRGSTCQ